MNYDVLECDRRVTPLGVVTYVRIHRKDMEPMGFRELWNAFDQFFPGRYAVQVFPPRSRLLDQANKYHLFVLDEPPLSMDLTEEPVLAERFNPRYREK